MTSRVLGSSFIKTVTKGSQSIMLKYATKTASWERPLGQASSTVTTGFSDAFAKFSDSMTASVAAAGTLVETEHPSQKDSYPHYSFVFHDKDGNELSMEHAYK